MRKISPLSDSDGAEPSLLFPALAFEAFFLLVAFFAVVFFLVVAFFAAVFFFGAAFLTSLAAEVPSELKSAPDSAVEAWLISAFYDPDSVP